MITSAEELGELWADFLGNKFSVTELELARDLYLYKDLNPLDPLDLTDDLTFEEFMTAIKRMKLGKTVGPDNIPVEIWKGSTLAQNELFFFLRQVWRHECIPRNLVLCAFIMLHKKQGRQQCV